VAESVRRPGDRLDPTRVPRSRHRPERHASSARPQVVPSLLSRDPHASGLDKDTPDCRPAAETSVGSIVAVPEVGGLHHRTSDAPRSADRYQSLTTSALAEGLSVSALTRLRRRTRGASGHVEARL
jgi:hypothetical protein